MSVPYLRLVPTKPPAPTASAVDRIAAAIAQMMADAAHLRGSARGLERCSRALGVLADRIEANTPLFAHARDRLLAERDRAYDIATDAALIERRILLSSPGNLAPLTSGLPARLQADARATRAA